MRCHQGACAAIAIICTIACNHVPTEWQLIGAHFPECSVQVDAVGGRGGGGGGRVAVETQLFGERDAAQVRSDLLDCQVPAVHVVRQSLKSSDCDVGCLCAFRCTGHCEGQSEIEQMMCIGLW